MDTLRFNVTIDSDVGALLRKMKNKSRFITEALREKFNREKWRKELEALQEAYRLADKDDRKSIEEWDAVSGDGL